MTTTIDNKVVEMAFQNSQFEKNVGTSLSTLDKLKKSLNFGDASKSFDGITKAAHGVDLSSIGNGINNISSRFSALGVIAITTLVNITNSALNAGKRIASALTIDPIKTGLNEYETKLNSVQTILANTQKEGTNLETVTKALNDLNTYSDKTIYNFQQMARNIGTFTAAGVKLDTSVAAIKGIANLAAISGSNADQASTAMYQLSQALSTGTVRLMDWNSVVNAGMGGQVFQDAVMETARVHGVAIDQIIKEEGSFRDSLQRGWFSSEILTETLQKFTGDLNKEQLRTMGYNEDQIAGIIKMGETANNAATKVKTFSQLFQTLSEAAQSGWAQTWEIIIGDFEEAKGFLTELNNWFGGIIGAAANARNELLNGWKDLGGRTKLIEAFQNVLNSIVTTLNPIREAMREIFPPITSQRLFEITESVRKFTERLIVSSETAEKIKRIFKGAFAVLDIGKIAIQAFIKQLGLLIGSYSETGSGLVDLLVKVGDWLVGLRNAIKEGSTFTLFFENLAKVIKSVIDGLSSLVGAFIGGFASIEKTNTASKSISNFLSELAEKFKAFGKLGGLISKIFGFLSKFAEKVGPVIGKITEKVGELFGSLFDAMTRGLDKLDFRDFLNVLDTGFNGGILLALSGFIKDSKKLVGEGLFAGILLSIKKFIDEGGSVFTGVKGILDSVKGSLEAYQKTLKANALLKIAGAIGILALSIIALTLVDQTKLINATAAIAAMFVGLATTIDVFEKTTSGGSKMISLTASLLGISAALLLLSGAVVILSKLDPKAALQGVAAIGGVLALLLLFQKYSASTGTIIDDSLGLIVFAGAMSVLASSIKKFGTMDLGNLAQGLVGMGAALTIVGVALKALSGSIAGSASLLVASGAILILAFAMEKMGNLSLEQIGIGLLALAGALTILGLAGAILTPVIPTIALLGISLLAIGAAVGAFGIGLGVLALGLAAVVTGLVAMSTVTAAGVAAITLLITGLAALIPMLAVQAVKGIEAFIVQLSKSAPKIALAGANILLEMVKGLSTILPQLVEAGAKIIIGILEGIRSHIGEIVVLSYDIITRFLNAIASKLPEIADSGFNLIISWIDAMTASVEENLPRLIQSVQELGLAIVKGVVTGLIQGHKDARAGILEIGRILVDGFKSYLGINSPSSVFMGLTLDVIRGIVNGLKNNVQLVVTEILDIGKKMVDNFKGNISNIYNAGKDLVQGLANGVKDYISTAVNAAGNLAKSVLDKIRSTLGIKSPSKKTFEMGMFADQGLAGGITKFAGVVLKSIQDLGNQAISGFGGVVSKISSSLDSGMDVNPTIRPVLDLSEIEAGGSQIESILGRKKLNLSLATIKASNVSTPGQTVSDTSTQQTGNAPYIKLEQNNYSPKALSRIEIYRQTKNALSQAKELVGAS